MKEVIIKNKEKYLKENYPFVDIPKMTEKKRCIHCDNIIIVGEYKVISDNNEEFICCPNAPECNGTLIDWVSVE